MKRPILPFAFLLAACPAWAEKGLSHPSAALAEWMESNGCGTTNEEAATFATSQGILTGDVDRMAFALIDSVYIREPDPGDKNLGILINWGCLSSVALIAGQGAAEVGLAL